MPGDKMLQDRTQENSAPGNGPNSHGIADFVESFEKIAKSAAAAALVFLIVFGCFYKLGEDHGQTTGQQIRLKEGKQTLKTLPREEAVLFWKDDKIIQGGLYGFLTVAVLSTFVLFSYYAAKPSVDRRAQWAVGALLYPNLMAAFFVIFFLTIGFRLSFNLAGWIVLTLSVALAICSWRCEPQSQQLAERTEEGLQIAAPPGAPRNTGLAIQLALLLGQTLLLSFSIGETRGIASSVLESYPLVQILDTTGHTTDCLRLLKTEGSEYHFVDSQGLEQIVPQSQIRTISLLSESGQGQTSRCPSSTAPATAPIPKR
jgi:hypothetical protein